MDFLKGHNFSSAPTRTPTPFFIKNDNKGLKPQFKKVHKIFDFKRTDF